MSDVTVVGVIAPSCFLQDIQTDVPHMQSVTIPADKAHYSKDLWRAISAKQVFRLQPGQAIVRPGQTSGPSASERDLRERADRLEQENVGLRKQIADQNAALAGQADDFKRAMAAQQERLDSILKLLANGVAVAQPVASGSGPRVVMSDVVADEIPTFIPAVITPEKAEARIETRRSEADNPDLAGAAGKLRELRRGKQ